MSMADEVKRTLDSLSIGERQKALDELRSVLLDAVYQMEREGAVDNLLDLLGTLEVASGCMRLSSRPHVSPPICPVATILAAQDGGQAGRDIRFQKAWRLCVAAGI